MEKEIKLKDDSSIALESLTIKLTHQEVRVLNSFVHSLIYVAPIAVNIDAIRKDFHEGASLLLKCVIRDSEMDEHLEDGVDLILTGVEKNAHRCILASALMDVMSVDRETATELIISAIKQKQSRIGHYKTISEVRPIFEILSSLGAELNIRRKSSMYRVTTSCNKNELKDLVGTLKRYCKIFNDTPKEELISSIKNTGTVLLTSDKESAQNIYRMLDSYGFKVTLNLE